MRCWQSRRETANAIRCIGVEGIRPQAYDRPACRCSRRPSPPAWPRPSWSPPTSSARSPRRCWSRGGGASTRPARARATRAPPTCCGSPGGAPAALALVGRRGQGRGAGRRLGWAVGGHGLGVACGVAAVVGHVLPVTRGFRGGKGVATGAGMAVVLFPAAAAVAVAGVRGHDRGSAARCRSGRSSPPCCSPSAAAAFGAPGPRGGGPGGVRGADRRPPSRQHRSPAPGDEPRLGAERPGTTG